MTPNRETAITVYGTASVIGVVLILSGHFALASLAILIVGVATVALTVMRFDEWRQERKFSRAVERSLRRLSGD